METHPKQIPPAERLRDPETMHQPDPRSDAFTNILDGSRPVEPSDYYNDMTIYRLGRHVPEHIVISFDTARNLYLYSWHVHRFLMVAQYHAFITLETALKEALGHTNDGEKLVDRPPGLPKLMQDAVAANLVRDQDFRVFHTKAIVNARQRKIWEAFEDLRHSELQEVPVDDLWISPKEEDYEGDVFLGMIESFRYLRNELAHGSRMLHPGVRGTFEIVCDAVNGMFKRAN